MMKTALLAGLMTLGIVIAGPAIASGEPKAWDKDKYDQCLLDEVDQGQLDPEDIAGYCCAISGGDWDQEVGQCVDPPAEAPITSPPRTPTQVTVVPTPVRRG